MGSCAVKRGFLIRLSSALARTGLALFVIASLFSRPESFHIALKPDVPANAGPFIIRLENSGEERNGDGAVTDWFSELWVHTSNGVGVGTTRVGSPFSFLGWRFYQSGWEDVPGRGVESTILCVYDPLVPVKATGLWALLAAGLLMVGGAVTSGQRSRRVWLSAVFFGLVFTWIVLDSVGVGQRSLPPVLRSAWFPPHLAAYMSAYAMLATAFLLAFAGIARERMDGLLRCLLRMGWGLLTCGIVLGALWAQQAWGTFWSWDPKESWALATWLSYLLCLHLPEPGSRRSRVWRAILVCLSFLILQMCWWGLKLLPSVGGSLHVY